VRDLAEALVLKIFKARRDLARARARMFSTNLVSKGGISFLFGRPETTRSTNFRVSGRSFREQLLRWFASPIVNERKARKIKKKERKKETP